MQKVVKVKSSRRKGRVIRAHTRKVNSSKSPIASKPTRKSIRVKNDWVHSKTTLPLESSERQKMWWQEEQAKMAPLNKVNRSSLKRIGFTKKKVATTVAPIVNKPTVVAPTPSIKAPSVTAMRKAPKKKYWFQKSMNELIAERKQRKVKQ